MITIHAALEIGTTNTVLAISESSGNGSPRVICHAEIPSAGVRKSQIVDVKQVAQSIRAAIAQIEKKQAESGVKFSLGNVFLVASGQHIRADQHQASVQIDGGKVHDADREAVVQSARDVELPDDRELLDIAEQDYGVDQYGNIPDPRGMAGRMLKLNTLRIHAEHNRIQDARTAAADSHLEIREPLFATTCAADAVLDDSERRNGVLVLDLGGGSTGYAVYTDDYLRAADVIGVGGDHVTNDIALAFQTTTGQAEELKLREASAVMTPGGADGERIRLPGSNTLMESRTISRRALDAVVNARLKETFSIIRECLEENDLAQRLHAGAVLTGGGASMRGIEELAEHELGIPVRIGRPRYIEGFDAEKAPSRFCAISGALMYAHQNYPEKSLLNKLLGDFFR